MAGDWRLVTVPAAVTIAIGGFVSVCYLAADRFETKIAGLQAEVQSCEAKSARAEADFRALELARDTMPLASLDELEVKAHLNPKQDLVLGCVKSDQKITVLESNIENGTWTLTCRGRSHHWEQIDYMLRVRRCRDLLNEDQ